MGLMNIDNYILQATKSGPSPGTTTNLWNWGSWEGL